MSSDPALIGPLMIDIPGTALRPEDRERLMHPLVGGMILFSRNYTDRAQLAALCAEVRALPRTRLLLAVDHEGGRVQRFRDGFSAVPTMRSIGLAYEQDTADGLAQARHWGRVIADELRAFDIDLCFAPVIDRDFGLSRVIGDRAFAAEPQAIIALARSFRAGLADGGMAATGKHFPGHGAVAPDSHVELPVDERTLEDIENTELVPFKALIADGIESIMMAHVRYTTVDDVPASFSDRWIGGMLRGQFGFDGAVFCDDLTMLGAAAVGDLASRARLALAAGCDMLPVCNDCEAIPALLDALADLTPDPVASQRLQRLYGRGPAAQH